MASGIDSIRTIVASKYSFLKVLVLSGALAYPLYRILFVKFEGWDTLWPILTIVMLIYNVGFILYTIHNEITDNPILIPGVFNPLQFVAVGLGTIIALGPMAALMGFAGVYLHQTATAKGFPEPFIIGLISLIEFLLFIVFEIQIIMYSHKLNPFHAYNVVRMFKNLSDFLYKTFVLLFYLALLSILTVSVGMLLFKMFGLTSFTFVYYVIFVTMFYLLIGLYYFGQIYMENLVANLDIDYDDDAGKVIDKDKMV